MVEDIDSKKKPKAINERHTFIVNRENFIVRRLMQLKVIKIWERSPEVEYLATSKRPPDLMG